MPARVLWKNFRWIAWTGGKPYKGAPYEKTGDVLLVADKPGEKWRTPGIPELDGKMGYCDTIGWPPWVPPEIAVNRNLRAVAEQNPNWIVLEYFEEPDWQPDPAPTHDEEGNLIFY